MEKYIWDEKYTTLNYQHRWHCRKKINEPEDQAIEAIQKQTRE